jgi:hypothetical protein
MNQQAKQKRKHARRVLLWVLGVLSVLAAAVLIHYRGVRAVCPVEYGDPVTAKDFTAREAVLEADTERLTLGWHFLNLSIGGVPTPVLVHVRDTVAPTAEPVDRIVPLGSDPGPDTFLKNIRDEGTVRVSFEEKPDFGAEWSDTIGIVLEDEGGNRTVVPVRTSVRATVETLTVEAGSGIPAAKRFIIEGVNAVQITPVEPDMLHHTGTYPIVFMTDGGIESTSMLTVVDTAAPYAEPTLLLLEPGTTAMPGDFVQNASDETDLSYSFVIAPDDANREVQTVVVRVTDEGGNSVDIESSLLITGVKPRIIEARREALTAEDFENNDGQTITVEPFVPDTPGSFAVGITVNGVAETLAVTVTDTTPPKLKQKADVKTKQFYTRHTYLPEDFFEARDVTAVTLTFDGDPDFDSPGERKVTVLARDLGGNETKASVRIVLSEDTEPPRIYGVIDRILYVGEPIAYLAEVFAEDAQDGPVEVRVESDVQLYEKGAYRVVYRAEDRSGNTSEAECTITLIEHTVTEEELRALAKSIMAEITTPDMVNAEKLRAIFDFVRERIVYANGVNSNYTDWRKAAYDGYTQRTGDCFNIYSLTRALLDEAGIRYLSIERLKTTTWRTRHYWTMVDLGTGWYIFDPTWTPRHRVDCFMWTKEQCSSISLYWNYDESRYPSLAETPFDYDSIVEMERSGQLP